MLIFRPLRLAAFLAALVIPTGVAQAGSIWTPVNTGLPASDTITAIAWPNANEIVLATGGGRILHGTIAGLASAAVTPANPTGFSDVSMSPDGTKGVAVGAGGQIYRSTDSGASWARIASPPVEYSNTYCSLSPSGTPPTSGPLSDDLYTVKFADAGTVYATGKSRDVLKSTDGGATFTEVNKQADGTCVAQGMGGDVTGQQWLDAIHGYLITNDFGEYYTTINGFATAAKQSPAAGSVNLGRARVAIDPGTPSHAWAISDGARNGSYFQSTLDNGGTWHTPSYDSNQFSFQDVAFGGGTVIAAGLQGDIYTSADGKTFTRQIADPPLNATDWHTVAVLDATHALVGGSGGVLLATAKANQVPDSVAPTGTVSGPKSLAVGQFGTYNVNATDDPGGSGIDPSSFSWSATGASGTQSGTTAKFAFATTGTHVVTVSFKDLAGNAAMATITVEVSMPPPLQTGSQSKSTGGGTVRTARKIIVTGHQHLIPVRVSSKAPRTFVLTLLTLKGHHHYVRAMKVTLKRGGKRTVTIKLPANVKAGSYLLVVRVLSLRGHGIGRQITFVLLLV